MILNLKETTRRNTEQDWLKTNVARFTGLMQGQRDLLTVARTRAVGTGAAGHRAARRLLHQRRTRTGTATPG